MRHNRNLFFRHCRWNCIVDTAASSDNLVLSLLLLLQTLSFHCCCCRFFILLLLLRLQPRSPPLSLLLRGCCWFLSTPQVRSSKGGDGTMLRDKQNIGRKIRWVVNPFCKQLRYHPMSVCLTVEKNRLLLLVSPSIWLSVCVFETLPTVDKTR